VGTSIRKRSEGVGNAREKTAVETEHAQEMLEEGEVRGRQKGKMSWTFEAMGWRVVEVT
jgi:hypothetical protein